MSWPPPSSFPFRSPLREYITSSTHAHTLTRPSPFYPSANARTQVKSWGPAASSPPPAGGEERQDGTYVYSDSVVYALSSSARKKKCLLTRRAAEGRARILIALTHIPRGDSPESPLPAPRFFAAAARASERGGTRKRRQSGTRRCRGSSSSWKVPRTFI